MSVQDYPIQPSQRSAVPPAQSRVDGFSAIPIRVKPKLKINDVAYVLSKEGEILLVAIEGFSYAAWLDYDGAAHVLKTQELYHVRYQRSSGVEWLPTSKVFKTKQMLIRSIKKQVAQ